MGSTFDNLISIDANSITTETLSSDFAALKNLTVSSSTSLSGPLSVTGDITQVSGVTILKDTAIGNISQNNGSIHQTGTVSNVLGSTTVNHLVVSESFVMPSDVSIPGSTYNNKNISMLGSAVITQTGTGTNVLKSSDFTGDVLFDGNITMTNADSVATLKTTNINNLTVTGTCTLPDGFVGATPVFSIGLVESVPSGTDPTVEIDNTDVKHPILNFQLETGKTPNLTIGTVTDSTSSASATITGASENPVLNLVLKQGIQGVQGDTGATGVTPNLTIGTVTDSTTSSSASIAGTSENPVLNLVLKQGIQGVQGNTGATGSRGPKGDDGDDGKDGSDGADGDSSVATASAIAAGAAAAVASTASIAASTSAAASAASATLAQSGVAELQYKTLLQSNHMGGATRFLNEVQVNNGVSTRVNLHSTGASEFWDGIQTSTIQPLGGEIGSVSVRGTTVNIGNANQLCMVHLNGIVNFSSGVAMAAGRFFAQY